MQHAYYTTEESANKVRVKSSTLRHALCLKGHYLGIRPVKLPNGRLLWPADEIDRLLSDEGTK